VFGFATERARCLENFLLFFPKEKLFFLMNGAGAGEKNITHPVHRDHKAISI
jgi:hypothetical protein